MLGLLLTLLALGGQDLPVVPIERRALAAAPAVDPAHPPKVIERPAWTRKPTGLAVHRVFPDRAMYLAIPGRAVVECRVRLDETLEGCRIVEETPAGMGFGAAVLRMTSEFRMSPLRHDGVAVDGAVIKVPITFSTPDSPPWSGGFILDQAVACVRWHKARLEVLPGDRESLRGVVYFSEMARKLGPRTGVTAEDIEAALGGAPVAQLLDSQNPSSLCRLAV